ncbi:conserved domain protein [Hyphomonas neptunium ATCC 15444]|uniref:Conserved domain protein n=2 Tax=Hyphomonas TaxID=85 RepID=Q0C248_HYPNA|nr:MULTISPECIES: DUF305 domain-containing protein [Hyphomonas]ABI77154.1 conserved domain protein [Hyphomonas neptunium ATCC 15444]KCZ93091.1 hypothetical protein HHI_10409 [Hyphomonas hirschiana VP5]
MDMKSNYWRFAAMIATSMVVMFGLMYLNTYAWQHVRWSETRFYMTVIMGAAMAVVMLAFMLKMYTDKKINFAVFAGAAIILLLALWLVRSQTTVQDRSYMRAMIPHHSIAILTSERAGIEDVRVRELADRIIAAQRREIKEMDWLIRDISENGVVKTQAQARERQVPEFDASSPQDPCTSRSASMAAAGAQS